jgi:ribosomal protein S2
MKRLTLALVSTAMLATTSLAADQNALAELRRDAIPVIASTCAQKWGTNYDMQLYCRNKQTAAMELLLNTMARAADRAADPATISSGKIWGGIIKECFHKWLSDDGNFDMANYCIEKQTTAYNQLQRQQSQALRAIGQPAKRSKPENEP